MTWRSWITRAVRSVWNTWECLLREKTNLALASGFFLTGTIWSVVSLIRHAALESHAFDLGIFTNAIWNLVQGNGYISSVKGGLPLFADHQSPLFWALAPIFAVFPRAETLLILQAFGLAAGAIPLYYLSAPYFKKASGASRRASWALAAIPLLYWTYLPIRYANAFDFHPEVLMLPLFLGAIAGLQSGIARARGAGLFCLLLALAAKESAGPVCIGIAAAWMLGAAPEGEARHFTRRIAPAVVLLGIAVFYFDIHWVPKHFGKEYAYTNAYRQYGGGLIDLALAPLFRTKAFFSQILGHERLKFLFRTLVPLGFLPLLNPNAFVAALPGYLMLFLTAGDLRLNLHFHYAIEPAVGLFWALPGGLARACEWASRAVARERWLRIVVLVCAIASFGWGGIYSMREHWPSAHARWVRDKVLPCLDPRASFAATEAWVPHLALRSWVHSLDSLRIADGSPVSCVAIDHASGNWPMSPNELKELDSKLPSDGYQEIFHRGEVSIFARQRERCMICVPKDEN